MTYVYILQTLAKSEHNCIGTAQGPRARLHDYFGLRSN